MEYWQRAIVQRRLVQPIRQAFRELYVLIPAEAQTCIYSNRFAGHATYPAEHISNAELFVSPAESHLMLFSDHNAVFEANMSQFLQS